jgi:ribosomal protein L35AE/L33A
MTDAELIQQVSDKIVGDLIEKIRQAFIEGMALGYMAGERHLTPQYLISAIRDTHGDKEAAMLTKQIAVLRARE